MSVSTTNLHHINDADPELEKSEANNEAKPSDSSEVRADNPPLKPSKRPKTSLSLTFLKFILPFIILAGSFSTYSYLKSTKPKPKKPVIVEKVWPVDAIAAIPTSQTPILQLYGKTVSSRQVELRALVSGKIIEVSNELKEGALVKKGDLLLKIDDFDYKGALQEARAYLAEAIAREAELKAGVTLDQENLKFTKAQLALAEKDFDRVDDLSKRGTVTKKLADDRKLIVSQRAQAVATSTINLDLQKARQNQQAAVVERLKWKVDQAERRLKETSLFAPFDAYVNSVSTEIGRTMNANDSVATLIDQNKVDVRFTLTDAQYGRIISHEKTLTGREVKIKWKVGETPIEYDAVIVRTGAKIASQTGGVEIYAEVKNPTKPIPLRSGAFVELQLNDRGYQNVYRLPQAALYDGNQIFIVKDDRLKPVTISVVGAAGSDTLVKSEALKPDDQILTTRLTLAGEGVKVKVREKTAKQQSDAPDKEPAAKGL